MINVYKLSSVSEVKSEVADVPAALLLALLVFALHLEDVLVQVPSRVTSSTIIISYERQFISAVTPTADVAQLKSRCNLYRCRTLCTKLQTMALFGVCTGRNTATEWSLLFTMRSKSLPNITINSHVTSTPVNLKASFAPLQLFFIPLQVRS